MSDIRFYNITCRTENGIFLGCDTPGKVRDLTFDNVTLRLDRRTAYEGGVYDRRPCVGEGFVDAPVYGIYADNVADVRVRDFRVVSNSFPAECYAGLYHWENCSDINIGK